MPCVVSATAVPVAAVTAVGNPCESRLQPDCCWHLHLLCTIQVVKEERRLARDKQAYARIRQAHAQSKRPTATTPAGLGLAALAGSDVTARRAAAGAVAAAARELRPVELVGIYESQKEVMEKELAAAKAEVRPGSIV